MFAENRLTVEDRHPRRRQPNPQQLARQSERHRIPLCVRGDVVVPGRLQLLPLDVLEPNIRGTKAIQQHLTQSTTGLKVVEFALDPSKPVITGDSAVQSILYQQQLKTPQGNTVQLTGQYTVNWVHAASGRWLIARLATSSASKP